MTTSGMPEVRSIGEILREHIEKMKREGIYYDPPVPGEPPRYRCEECGAEVELEKAYLACSRDGAWSLECSNHNDARYDVRIGSFFASPSESIDWLAQVAAKRWFDPVSFFALMTRIRSQRSGFYRTPARPAEPESTATEAEG